MTRFAADTPSDRQKLFAEGIEAHRERASPFVTIEAELPGEGTVPPWVQYVAEDQLLNLDCRESEVGDIEAVLSDFGGASISERASPEEADGVNIRIRVSGDTERVAMLMEELFRTGFGLPEDYRAWVVEV